MPTVTLPNDWTPRDYQLSAWRYLEGGGRHAELIWPRRHGKDDLALHYTACAMMERVGNYWHMLPLSNQVRKAIWEAVNPKTGMRRIDEAFPKELRASTRESDMFITLKNGSTWQTLGSNNYEGAIGSNPVGIVYSEWAQAHPSVRGFLRPIITENKGWQIFITTPRGKNHAYKTFRAAKNNPDSFAELLTSNDTGLYSADQLDIELQEYVDTYGEDIGKALWLQEYFCSFDAPTLGAVWGKELTEMEARGGVTEVPHDPAYPVHVAMDIGSSDATVIWFYQVIANEVRFIDYEADNFREPDYFVGRMLGKEVLLDIVQGEIVVQYGEDIEDCSHRQSYRYEQVWLPHDAKAKRFGSKKTVEEQFRAIFGNKVYRLEIMSKQDGIKHVRQMLRKSWFDKRCDEGVEACKSYHYEWDKDKHKFKDEPVHDWASDPADALRYVASAYFEKSTPKTPGDMPVKGLDSMTLDDLWSTSRRERRV